MSDAGDGPSGPDRDRRDSGSRPGRRGGDRPPGPRGLDRPAPERRGAGDDRPTSLLGWVKWFWTADSGLVVYVRDVVSSAGAVVLVALVLFAISGLWPPMVAVESSSMRPNLQVGDLVFVMEEERFAPAAAYGESGVVTHRTGRRVGYTKFGAPGDVIVYKPSGNGRLTPIIHRAMFHVNESENWYDKADPDDVGGADGCQELDHCPAPYDGFITKGDNEGTNAAYDQVSGLAPPVREEWIVGTAEFRIPWLGNIRLWATHVGIPPATGATPGSPAAPTPACAWG